MQPTLTTYAASDLALEPSYTLAHALDKVRHVLNQPRLVNIKYSLRNLHGLLTYPELRRMQALTTALPLQPLLAQQHRFVYKYLSSYTAASFSRSQRLAAILQHYAFLGAVAKPQFFAALAGRVVLWQEQHGDDVFTISLSYPLFAFFEGELSLNFSVNSTVVQVVVFVVVPGQLVQLPDAQTMLVGQVQGMQYPELIKLATKSLQDITPAALLVNAAYGLAAAWQLPHLAGVSKQQQLSVRTRTSGGFDYDRFWEQFNGQRTAANFYMLAVNDPEKPLEEVKAKYRARTLRKRQFKQGVRTAVEQSLRSSYLK